jgi:hypothetical protein
MQAVRVRLLEWLTGARLGRYQLLGCSNTCVCCIVVSGMRTYIWAAFISSGKCWWSACWLAGRPEAKRSHI